VLYLDTAVRDELAPLLATGLFDGVTTNPKILHGAGLAWSDLPALYGWCREHGARLVFMQATGRDVEELRQRSRELLAIGDAVRVKLVCTTAALQVARELADDGHEVLVTAVHHPAQGLAAAAAGARFIAPYVGRVDDAGRSGLETLTALRRVIDVAGAATLRVLAASLRSADAVAGAAAAGADDLTFSAEVARALLEDATTVAAADEFEQLAAAR
jgi:TalC/MipB family fructose-6-phosphate aldolase